VLRHTDILRFLQQEQCPTKSVLTTSTSRHRPTPALFHMASTNDFASGLQALANPHDEFASGLQALADWEYAAAPSPAAGLPSDSLPASPSSSYDYYYG